MDGLKALDIHKFLTAQSPVITEVQAELRAGHKRTHWMWVIFPKLQALGRSATALVWPGA